MIKVIVQSNGKKEKEMKFKYANKALDFMYMCPSKGMFILGYYGESELDDSDIWWLNNRIAVLIEEGLSQKERLTKLNKIAIHQMSILEEQNLKVLK